MISESLLLLGTAASIGFIHTLFGPDHYLPFVVISKARRWSSAKTFFITFLCGLGHVGSSVILGLVGIALGIAMTRLEIIEGTRGDLAAWFFIIFGFTYFVWGTHRAIKNKPHTHLHFHKNGSTHHHRHTHKDEHTHVHEEKVNITPWILFTIFVFGPCEPLIPLVMYPAAKGSITMVLLVAGVFAATTITTMLAMVTVLSAGIHKIKLGVLERWSHSLAGAVIFLSGVGIKFLGL